tara:strand:+ start:849 stop:1028 length:180 start_codon:yes stop_codon:yes gene_type:complete
MIKVIFNTAELYGLHKLLNDHIQNNSGQHINYYKNESTSAYNLRDKIHRHIIYSEEKSK